MAKVLKLLTHADPQVTLSQNTANVLSPIITATVPRGLGWVIPGNFPLVLKLQKADGTEISPESKLYIGIKVPSEPDRIWPVGFRVLYYPWAELSLDKQFDADYRDAIKIDLAMDILPLTEDEQLIIMLQSPDQISTSKVRFYIPYWERASIEIGEELTYRASILRV